jgi:Ras GTPase-activating protein 3
MVSKMMDESMHISGMRYLHETLRPPLERLLAERRPCEIDPARVKDTTVISHNLANLKVNTNCLHLFQK